MASLNLALFFTRNTSLQTWDRTGTIEREAAIYQALAKWGVRTRFVTYGDKKDLGYRERVPGIKVLCNRWGLPKRYYKLLITYLAPLLWPKDTIVKSNQVKGADVALRAAQRFRKLPLVARCGYLHSDFMERQYGAVSYKTERARKLENKVFTKADKVIVTTSQMRESIIQQYEILETKVNVIPNYVDTALFRPVQAASRSKKRICFIGRLEKQKNLLALLCAVKNMDVELLLVGSGSLSTELKEYAEQNVINVRLPGNLPHSKLPGIINQSSLFILPSHYEGHPKVLIEAMSCGVPVIGTDVSGIRELIEHRQTGYLCGVSPEEIREAIRTVMSDQALQKHMGRNARSFVKENFSLERIAEMEMDLLSTL